MTAAAGRHVMMRLTVADSGFRGRQLRQVECRRRKNRGAAGAKSIWRWGMEWGVSPPYRGWTWEWAPEFFHSWVSKGVFWCIL